MNKDTLHYTHQRPAGEREVLIEEDLYRLAHVAIDILRAYDMQPPQAILSACLAVGDIVKREVKRDPILEEQGIAYEAYIELRDLVGSHKGPRFWEAEHSAEYTTKAYEALSKAYHKAREARRIAIENE